MAKYTLEAFFLTTFPSAQKKRPKIYTVTLVLPLNVNSFIQNNSHLTTNVSLEYFIQMYPTV